MENVLSRKSSIKKIFASAGIAAVMSIGFVAGASADSLTKSDDVDMTITGGELILDTPEITGYGEIDLKPTPEVHYTGFEDVVKISDLRGSQEGWGLTVTASQFELVDGDNILPQGSLTLGSVASVDGPEDYVEADPIITLEESTVIDTDEPVHVVSAEVGTGMGVFDISFDEDALALTVDAATATEGTYKSQLTWTLQSVPNAG